MLDETTTPPVFDIRTCTYGEALSIYLYAHFQIDDVRDVGQAEIVRGKENSSSDSADTAFISYITRGANSERRRWQIPAEPVEFSFVLQQTLARYDSGLVDVDVAFFQKDRADAQAAVDSSYDASMAKATTGTDSTWSADPDQDA